MFIKFLIPLVFTYAHVPKDSIRAFREFLGDKIQSTLMNPPPGNNCYHYIELVKVEINKNSKITSVDFSDSAPAWIQTISKKNFPLYSSKFRKLDTLAAKIGYKNCNLLFPLTIESDDFPCGSENKKRKLEDNYFQFNGTLLKGNIVFGETIHIIYSTDYKYKKME